MSELFEHVVSTLGTVHRLTTAYHPQTNATERVNRTLKTAIHAYIGDKHASWDKYLSQICFALRTAPHESTGLSPSKMLYGRELDTPLDLITQPSSNGVEEPGVPYPETLKASLWEAHDHARATLDRSHERQKHYYDLRRRQASYVVGDLVRVKTHPRPDAQANFTAKLAPLFSGPLRVSQKLGDVNYRLTRLDTGVDAWVFHVVNLQPFHTWNSPSTRRSAVPTAVTQQGAEALVADTPIADSYVDAPTTDLFCDTSGDADPTPTMDYDSSLNSDQASDRYDLRPRRCPRITSGWSDNRWTNAYHADRLDVR